MDRSRIFAAQHSAAVRTAGSAALHLLLSAAAGDRGEPAPDAPVRRVVPEIPVLREPQDGLRVGHQSQTRATADADSGHRSPLSQTELEPPGTGSQDLPVSAARRGNPPAQPRLEHRYYLHSDAWRLSVSGRGDGLVQPLRAQLGTVQHHGDRLLPGRASGGIPLRPTRNLELRSGIAVHCGRLPGSAEEARGLNQYGWPRSRTRQRFHRTPVALLKYELIYPGDFATGLELFPALENYFHFYNHQRPHQALGYRTPADLFPHRSKRKRSLS